MKMKRLITYMAISLLLVSCTGKEETATIRVDCAKTMGSFRSFGNYLNNSIRHAPPPELAEVMEKQYGKPEIIRCWLTLDDMWDYRTGKYNYNFQLGLDTYAGDTVKHKYDRERVTETPYMYYDYIRAFSRHSKKVLLNIRRYEHEVTRGIITMEQWKEVAGNGVRHYKKMCPNICYIEVLNESNWSHFGGLDDTEYYDFYRAVYQIVNELNAEMQPEIPLQVGGTAASGKPLTASDPHEKEFNLSNKAQHLYRFFGHFSKDPDPQKRLDFVSFHEYAVADTPVVLREYEPLIDGWLGENGLSTDLPLFLDESGAGHSKPDPEKNFKQASGMTTYFYYTRQSQDMRLFPWVLYHHPRQRSLVMFDEGLKMTPFGMAVKMMKLHRKTEVKAASDCILPSGKGVYALASRDEKSIAIQAWNYMDTGMTVTLIPENLPAALTNNALTLEKYLIDTRHNNALTGHSQGESLKVSEKRTLKKGKHPRMTVRLEPNAFCMWILREPEPARSGQ